LRALRSVVRCWRAWLVLSVAIAASFAYAEEAASAAAVKAAYLSKFLNYIELPVTTLRDNDGPLVIGVAGAEDVYNALVQAIQERSAGARRLMAVRLNEADSPAGLHLLFVGQQIDPLHSALVHAARERSVLLVTDSPNGLKAGACINFVTVANRIRFEVSLEAAEANSIRISSRVLALAERVVGSH
jgi:hypothetical protein